MAPGGTVTYFNVQVGELRIPSKHRGACGLPTLVSPPIPPPPGNPGEPPPPAQKPLRPQHCRPRLLPGVSSSRPAALPARGWQGRPKFRFSFAGINAQTDGAGAHGSLQVGCPLPGVSACESLVVP